MAVEGEAGITNGPGALLDLRGGVPDDRLASDLSLEEVAKAAHLSPRHLSRLFRSSTGLSPHQYVIRQRVERAKRLLHNTDFSVGEVAQSCGFSHQGHLSRHFVRLTGATPRGSAVSRAANSQGLRPRRKSFGAALLEWQERAQTRP